MEWDKPFPANPYTSAPGVLRQVPVAAPAAGAEWVWPVDVAGWYRLRSGFAVFTASAAIANRLPGLVIRDADKVALRVGGSGIVAASTVVDVNYINGPVSAVGVSTGQSCLVGLPFIYLQLGWSLGSFTKLIDVADQYSQINLYMEQVEFGQWAEPGTHDGHRRHVPLLELEV